MRVVICDDDKKICRILKEKVSLIIPGAEVHSFYSGQELLKAQIDPDILLLDIRMPGMDGMDVAVKLRDHGWKKILIFITGEKDRVFHAFDVQAFHFLVKPVRDEQLKEVLTRALSLLNEESKGSGTQERYISVKTTTSHIRINLSDILYAEVFNRKTVIYRVPNSIKNSEPVLDQAAGLPDGVSGEARFSSAFPLLRSKSHPATDEIEYYGQLSDLEKLAGKDFYRVHRSFLVNLRYVELYNGKFIRLTNGKEIPMARRNYQGFVSMYMEYCRKTGAI